jgi:hypothetical protein
MKRHHLLILACCLNHATGQTTAKAPVMRDVATHQQLARNLRQSQQEDPMKRLEIASGEDPSKKNVPKDLMSQSDIICFNGLATQVPNSAILVSPANMKDRLEMTPNAKSDGWSEFYIANRGWITTEEVSFEQASGKLPLSEATIKQIAKSRNLIVATYLGGPISVAASKETIVITNTRK